ncbi:hypothetical protein K353_00089 [Kitasatospora sp. SolWspMP-SS2h]|uniref:MOSC domain-containing protein n=1 Tax=Kitasatospora sp. SolWspMP-SS2h TaxID=1305729 RepID=UPI000DB96266|nr:MOSC N-terminal beta barrel domain-containing protein [Kitasatospora sp. SolWspMP-SS2h]RAJ46888.1 hypothetical protein K353_00089 [Kitasatospora sp. SolWspMP-SS2h]
MAGVAELICHPVKGCAGTSATEAFLTPAGLAHDRSFMVVGEDGTYRTQRRHPRLALVRPAVSPDGTRLTLAPADGRDRFGTVRLDVTTTAPRRDVDLFGTAFRGIDQGGEVAAWLSEFLGIPSRLVRVPSRASPALLDRRLAERGTPPLPVNRFRPNIVVVGSHGHDCEGHDCEGHDCEGHDCEGHGDDWAAVPHAEDRARRLTIGADESGHAKLTVRCAVTLVEQETGARRGPEPLRTLAGYRRAASGGVVFGAKFSVLTPGKLSVGDEVAVREWGDPERVS